MEENRIVVSTRKIGKSYLFKINLESPVVQKLMELDKKLMMESIEQVKEETIPVSIDSSFHGKP